MILDRQNRFSDAQAVTSDAASTDYLDFGPLASGQAGRDIGAGEQLRLVVITDTAAESTSTSTVTFILQTDEYNDFTTATAVFTSEAIAKATLVAGYKAVDAPVPKLPSNAQYMRVYYDITGAVLTAGAFTAMLVLDSQDNVPYKAGYSFASGA